MSSVIFLDELVEGSKRNPKIAIMGLIGTGKTTFSKIFSKFIRDYTLVEENTTKNEMFEPFCNNMEKYSIAFELSILFDRIEQHEKSDESDSIIYDRSIYEDKAFVEMLVNSNFIDRMQANVYYKYFNKLINNNLHCEYDLIIYLKCDPKVCIERIQKRNRQGEVENIELEYLQSLEKQYEILEKEMVKNGVKVLKIDWNKNRTIEEIEDFIKLRFV